MLFGKFNKHLIRLKTMTLLNSVVLLTCLVGAAFALAMAVSAFLHWLWRDYPEDEEDDNEW